MITFSNCQTHLSRYLSITNWRSPRYITVSTPLVEMTSEIQELGQDINSLRLVLSSTIEKLEACSFFLSAITISSTNLALGLTSQDHNVRSHHEQLSIARAQIKERLNE